jgi:hypothetical protein
MTHHFDVEVAKKLGVNAAIIVANLAYLQRNREAQGGEKYHIDGRWWVHHTYDSLAVVHPYFSVQQIRRIMRKLLEQEVVFHCTPDHWHRDSYWSVALDFVHVSESTDASVEIDSSQQAKSTVVLHDNNIITIKSERQDTFDSWWAKYPKKQGKKQALKKFMGLSADKLSACLEDDLSARYGKTEYQFIPNPSTYLNGERWDDELEGGTEGCDSPFERYKNT